MSDLEPVAAPSASSADSPAASCAAAPLAPGGRSLRAYLARVLLVVTLPLLLAAGFLAAEFVAERQRDFAFEARLRADEVTATIDRVVLSHQRGLALLAEAPGAANPALRANFRALAESFTQHYRAHVVLASTDGEMLMNTRVAEGVALPRMPRGSARMAAPLAAATGKPAVSDTFLGPVAGQTLVATAVPVQREGRVVNVVVATQGARFFERFLRRASLQPGWTMSLRDGAGRVIASTAADPARAADTPYRFATPSEISGWSVYVEIAPEVMAAPLYQAAAVVGALVLLAAALGLLGGALAARRLGLAVAGLVDDRAPPAGAARVLEIEQARARLERSAHERAGALGDALRARNVLHEMLARVSDGFAALDREWRFTYVNRRAEQMMGREGRGSPVGERVWDLLPALRGGRWHRAAQRALASGRPERVETYDAAHDQWIELRVFPGEDGLSVFFADVSARRRAEAALHESAQRYQLLFRANPGPMWVYDIETLRFLDVNDAAVRRYGWSREEFLALTLADIRPPEDLPQLGGVTRLLEGDPAGTVRAVGRFRHRTRDGHIIDVEIASSALDFEGRGARLVNATDITERLAAERGRDAALAQLRDMFDANPNPTLVRELDSLRIRAANDAAVAAYGYSRDELLAMTLVQLHAPENQARVEAAADAARGEPQRTLRQPHPWLQRRKDGTLFEAEIVSSPLEFEGRPARILVVIDVSARLRLERERDRAQASVQASEARLRALFEHSMDMIFMSRPDGAVEAANPAACRALGLAEDEIRARGRAGVVDEADPAFARTLALRVREGQARAELTMIRASGERFPVELSTVLYRDADGAEFTSTFARDISERRRAEAVLREREERLRMFVEHAPVALAMLDREMRYVVASRRWRQDYGLAAQDLTGRSHYELFPEIGARWQAVHRRGLAGEVVGAAEDRFERADGGVQWLHWEVRPWFEAEGGAIGGILIYSEDISARKQAELQLAAQRAQLDAALAAMPDAVYIADTAGRFVETNEAFRQLFRFGPDGRAARTTLDFRDYIDVFAPDGRPLPFEQWPAPAALRGTSGSDVALRVRFKESGASLDASFTSAPIRDAAGAVVGAVVTARDITERIAAERALRRSEQRFKTLAEQMPAIIYRVGEAGAAAADYVSAFISSLGYTAEQWTSSAGPNWLTALHPEDRPRVLETRSRLHMAGEDSVLEYRLRDSQGRWRDFIDHGRYVEGDGDGARVFQGVSVEITQLKRSEQALREAEAYQRSLFETQADGVLLLDAGQHVLDANPAALKMLGAGRDTLLARELAELVVERDRPRVHAAMRERLLAAPADAAAPLVEWEQLRADGSSFAAEVSLRAGPGGRVVAVLRDVAERRAAQRALLAYQLELSELTRRLLTQERETTRHVAQTLHDRLGQSLTVARLRLDAASVRLGEAMPPPLKHAWAQVGDALDAAIGDVRVVLGELRPPMLEDQGLIAALDNEIRTRTLAAGSVDVLLEIDEGRFAARWPADVEYAAFMIAREAIFNAQRHAEASLVRVIVDGGAGALELQVADDGRGIPDALRAGRAGHLGIVGMRERAIAIGAQFAVEQPEAGGTRIVLRWHEKSKT